MIRQLALIDGTANFALPENPHVQPSVCALQFKFTWVKQEENNLKHTSKSTSELLKDERFWHALVKVQT